MAEEKKPFPVVMVVIFIVVGLLLAGGISYFIATKAVANNGTSSERREAGVFMKLGDPKEGLIVNIGGVNSGRYLKIGVILELKPNKKAAEADPKAISPDEVKILDAVVQVLRSQKIEDFDPVKQDNLKGLIRSEVNRVLGEERVYEVYITNFVLQ